MVADTVAFLVAEGREVVLDAEHFFDGWLLDRAYALEVLQVALASGATTAALCDTNGGHLPDVVADLVADVVAVTGARLGIHCHNDTGCAVASTLAAVDAGVVQVQGTLNGYGERTGNADLVTVLANLELKRDRRVLPPGGLAEATRIAHAVSEITNVPPYSRQPYVGSSAFTHKAGLHASAIRVDPDLYQHVDPTAVGNDMRMLVSEMAGRASIELKGRELGLDLSDPSLLSTVTDAVKAREQQGYTYEAADASFELLVRRVACELRLGDDVPTTSTSTPGASSPRPAPAPATATRPPRRRSAWSRRRADGGDRGGQRPGQRSRRRPPDSPHADVPRAAGPGAGRLPGPDPRLLARHRRGHPGPAGDRRRRGELDHRRRRAQHRRGIVGGARRRARLRAAPPAGADPA
jgi:hypothetical protein